MSPTLQSALKWAKKISYSEYDEALHEKAEAEKFFDNFFNDFDVILCLSALGEAPSAESGTGSPICSTIWTLCGLPSISIPLLTGNRDLPIGIQLIGQLEFDHRLLRITNWLIKAIKRSNMLR